MPNVDLEAEMDALELLTADHNRVRGLFARYKDAAEAKQTEKAAALVTEIFVELEVHTTIEEELFYPWAHDLADEIGATIDEGIEEHHVVKVLMEEINELDAGSDTWTAKLKVLIENVEHHAGEEEDELFPPIRSHTKAPERAKVGEQLDAKKGALGAPVLADTIDLADERLRELASAQAIPGRSKMDHDELAATVSPG
ncbi:MAG: hypothetical protein QOE63_255 [Acidimicrobiaceae bacterium]|jgi:hemerythrin superfamily protein